MPNILLTGITTLDIINSLSCYPEEDSEVRASAQHTQSGGNASNCAIVMQQLGINTYLLVNRADDLHAQQIFSSLNAQQINTSLCPVQKNSITPTSYITLNVSNGSRSIVHYRDLCELPSATFLSLDLQHIDWFHFEARDCSQLLPMLKKSRTYNKPVSIELEKTRDGIDDIMPYADLLLISRPFAQSRGFNTATDCLEHFSSRFPDTIITCSWGDRGAWVYNKSAIIYQTAFNIEHITETLGAGDTFNAGFIASLIKHGDPVDALKFACRLAANKCQQTGFFQLNIPD
jgi:ketohexokinase